MKTIIGIDPGATGGIAVATSIHQATVYNMPETRKDTINLLRYIVREPVLTVAYIEKISGYIPDGGPSQMFEFGKSVERVGCILETLGVRIIEIAPQAWHKQLGIGSMQKRKAPRAPKGMDKVAMSIWKQQNANEIKSVKAHNAAVKRDFKNYLKAEAQRRFPYLKVTLKNCDALLILDVAIKLERNQ